MNCSSIPNEIFEQVRRHTNAVEQAHNKSYSGGRYLELVAAIEA